MPKFLLLSLFCIVCPFSYSQCNITIVGTPCLETNLQLFCNSNNGIIHYWKFNSDDSFSLNCNAQYGFLSPGLKRITLRVKDINGNTCLDTAYITIRSVTAHMNIGQSRPLCETVIELSDSSYIIQPADSLQDSIIRWTYQWYDNSEKTVNIYNKLSAKNFKALLNHNGNHPLKLTTLTKYGCENTESEMLYIPGPIPDFDTFIRHKYCTNEEVGFKNRSKYTLNDSCIWVWDFGDKLYANQYDSYTDKDTVWHHYINKGFYNVTLYLFYSTISGNGNRRTCSERFPDTAGLNIDPVKLDIEDCSSSLSKQYLGNDISVFPNPAANKFQITGADNIEIYILNIYGSVIHHFYNISNQLIELGNIPDGMYLLTDNNFRVLSKLIVKRE